ncbi:MAG: hypothetical protein HRU15_14565, partial [Planctomycetes bacterium]|nr:hypothetical protein [Planctomycetota bacterium]
MTYFTLEAFEHVHKDQVDAYLAMSKATDAAVQATEPGMLIHAQTIVEETAEKTVFRWLEVYQSYPDFERHITNPVVQEHVKKLNDGMLCAPLEVIFYCDWDDEQKKPWLAVEGL